MHGSFSVPFPPRWVAAAGYPLQAAFRALFAGAAAMDFPLDEPPGQSAEAARIRCSAFIRSGSAPGGCHEGASAGMRPSGRFYAGAAASCVTRLRTAIAAVVLPSHVPFLQRNRAGLSGSEKKKPYPYPNSPIPHIMPFSCFFLQKTQFFSFFARVCLPPHFRPFMLMAAKTVSSLWPVQLLKEKKRAELSFS